MKSILRNIAITSVLATAGAADPAPRNNKSAILYKGRFYVRLDGSGANRMPHHIKAWQAAGWRTEGQMKKLAAKRQRRTSVSSK